ncbi:type II toxin-antitoxin system death-on-curing family toxin [Helicobacter sp. MIT 11-5569]|nr:Fic family protein [Helicobacter sp. MIT 11-5569]TLD84997.1 type II toxin-antitoxin system death-on-curing family toxin [Helicobacter sp. MIT 11-5569]
MANYFDAKGANPKQIGLLDSALIQIQNDDYYPNFIDKLTHLMFACVKFHPFADGNKRTAIYIAKAFIKANKPEILPTNFYQELEYIIVCVADDSVSKDELKGILKHLLGLVCKQ